MSFSTETTRLFIQLIMSISLYAAVVVLAGAAVLSCNAQTDCIGISYDACVSTDGYVRRGREGEGDGRGS
jgi:hypothetical protein